MAFITITWVHIAYYIISKDEKKTVNFDTKPLNISSTDLLHECVSYNIIGAPEKQEVACLIPLDLSAAFDTIDHDILHGRLKWRFAVTGTTLNWLWSYLTHRTRGVEIGVWLSGGSRSAFVQLELGIPQGSALGPTLFTIYTVPIGDICMKTSSWIPSLCWWHPNISII